MTVVDLLTLRHGARDVHMAYRSDVNDIGHLIGQKVEALLTEVY